MQASSITAVTCTIGDSAAYLQVLLRELRKFSSIPFEQIVSDDGTISEAALARQKQICRELGAKHVHNPGPWGLAENLDFACRHVETDWLMAVEDGLRPSYKWLEATTQAITAIDQVSEDGWRVSMIGHQAIQDWQLVLAELLPTRFSSRCWYDNGAGFSDDRLHDFFHGNWNSGFLTIPVVANSVTKRGRMAWSPRPRDDMIAYLNWVKNCDESTYWPNSSSLRLCFAPGGIVAIRMSALREVGGFRHDCSCYEGHLAVRLVRAGHLSTFLEGPPFLHTPSTGFRSAWKEKLSRAHTTPKDIYKTDFGTVDLNSLILDSLPQAKQDELNAWLYSLVAAAVKYP